MEIFMAIILLIIAVLLIITILVAAIRNESKQTQEKQEFSEQESKQYLSKEKLKQFLMEAMEETEQGTDVPRVEHSLEDVYSQLKCVEVWAILIFIILLIFFIEHCYASFKIAQVYSNAYKYIRW